MEKLTKKQCQSILFNLGIGLGVSPRLISMRLLDDRDKEDMMLGLIEIAALRAHTALWRDNGLPDYATGSKVLYKEENHPIKPLPLITAKTKYRQPFKEWE
jgi:hypothetical protein